MRFYITTTIVLCTVVVTTLIAIGWSGIASKATVAQGSCVQHYTHYIIEPWLRTRWQCARQMPCGVDEGLDRYNAKVQVGLCLCDNQSNNSQIILDWYKNQVQPEPVFHGTSPSTVEGICAEGFREAGRL
jgi:hypothetical protein